MKKKTIKSLKNQLIKLTGKHGIERQKAIIKNCNLKIEINKIRKDKALAHINIFALQGAKKALGLHSNRQLYNALKQLRNN